MKTVFFLIISTLLLFACKKKDDNMNNSTDKNRCDLYIESNLDFKVYDIKGNNLLSNRAMNYLTYDNIDVIYFYKGKEIVYNKPLLTDSKGYSIQKDNSGDEFICLYLALPVGNSSESISYLRFNHTDLDTIKASFKLASGLNESYKGSLSLEKVWYNGNLILDKTAGISSELPIIIK